MIKIKEKLFKIVPVITLMICAAAVYLIQILIFRSPGDTFFYFFQDLAFLPVEILIVTLIVNRIISSRQRKERLKKMNMVISTFFGEAGTHLITLLSQFQENFHTLRDTLEISSQWDEAKFANAAERIRSYNFLIQSTAGNLDTLKTFLLEKRMFLLSLLENPNLLEHESFTDMLWAVFHLTDELASRNSVVSLPQNDYEHLSTDIKRAYGHLIYEWLHYMKHLKTDYPYLFSLAVRKNPFDPEASVIINDVKPIK